MSNSIRDQFFEIRERLLREGHEPVRVIFSPRGLDKAMHEADVRPGYSDTCPPPTYMGLPYTVRSDMAGDIGLDYKFENRHDAVTVKLGFSAQTGHVLVDGKPFGEPVHLLQIVGGQLTLPQLSEIIQGWIDAHPNDHLRTNMLVDWLQTFGSFE